MKTVSSHLCYKIYSAKEVVEHAKNLLFVRNV